MCGIGDTASPILGFFSHCVGQICWSPSLQGKVKFYDMGNLNEWKQKEKIDGIHAMTLASGEVTNDHDCDPVWAGSFCPPIELPSRRNLSIGVACQWTLSPWPVFSRWAETPTQNPHPLFPFMVHTSLKMEEAMSPSRFSTAWVCQIVQVQN